MDKQTLLSKMYTERLQWEQLLAGISEQHLTQPNVVGKWSIRDVIAHITVWETVEALSEDDLINPERQFVGLEWKGKHSLWDIIANQSYLHDQLHATSVHTWLDQLNA